MTSPTKFSLLLLLLLPLASSQPASPAPFDPRADPQCASGRGIIGGNACCPASCKICGGMACDKRMGGGFCCIGIIRGLNRGCDFVGPPCTVDGGDPLITPSPSPSPVITPAWKNINSNVTGMLTHRAEACFVMVKGKAYLMGGRGQPILTDIFNPKTRTWTKGKAPPFEFHHAKCIAYRNKVFVPVSFSGLFPKEKQNTKMLVYDTNKNVWTKRPGLPGMRNRAAAGAVLHNDKIYVVAGAVNGHGKGSFVVGWFDYYDLVTKNWVTGLPRLPVARSHTGAEIINGKLCVAGGRTGSIVNPIVVPSTYCYNFATKVWTNVNAPLPGIRWNAAYGKTCDGKMIVAGGEGVRPKAYGRVDLFDGFTWTKGVNLAFARHGTGLALARCRKCGQVFIAAGQGRNEDRQKLGSIEVLLEDGVDKICANY